jgi:hypothetical protein
MPGSVFLYELEVFRRRATVRAALWGVFPGLNIAAA